jgi:ADP-ribose pyrophosphatase
MDKEIVKVNKKIVYQSKNNSIRKDTVIYKNGHKETYEILQSPQGVLILPVKQDGKIILNKEFRHNHGWIYCLPMGKKEKDDHDALYAAKRELEQESGLTAAKWTLISTHHNGIHEEGLNYFYIAEGLKFNDPIRDQDEEIEVVETTFANAFELMSKGKIVDLPSRACIWAGYIHLQNRNK